MAETYELGRDDERTSICPHCGKLNAGIRRVPAFADHGYMTFVYSCAKCKRIIGIESLPMPVEAETK